MRACRGAGFSSLFAAHSRRSESRDERCSHNIISASLYANEGVENDRERERQRATERVRQQQHESRQPGRLTDGLLRRGVQGVPHTFALLGRAECAPASGGGSLGLSADRGAGQRQCAKAPVCQCGVPISKGWPNDATTRHAGGWPKDRHARSCNV